MVLPVVIPAVESPSPGEPDDSYTRHGCQLYWRLGAILYEVGLRIERIAAVPVTTDGDESQKEGGGQASARFGLLHVGDSGSLSRNGVAGADRRL